MAQCIMSEPLLKFQSQHSHNRYDLFIRFCWLSVWSHNAPDLSFVLYNCCYYFHSFNIHCLFLRMVNAEMDSNDSRPTMNDKKRNLERSKIDGYTNDCSPHVPITPQKLGTRMEDPLTPTANLKMLVSAAFRMSHDSGQQKRELFNDNVVDNDDDDDDEYLEDSCSTISDLIDEKQDQLLANEKKPRNAVDTVSSGRKLKSLGLLCKK